VDRITRRLLAQTDANVPETLLGSVLGSAKDVKSATGNIAHQLDPEAPGTIAATARRVAGNLQAATDPNVPSSLMAKVHVTMDGLQGIVEDGGPKIDRALAAVANTAEKIEAYTKWDVGEILAGLRESNTKILRIVSNFEEVSEEVRQIATLNRDNVDEMLDNLAQVSADFKATMKEVRRNPWRLLYRPGTQEVRSQNLYDAVRSFSDGASQLDQAIAKLRVLQKVQGDSPALVAETTKNVHKHLQETFKKFSKAEEALWKELEK
jgi:methyl-accepting chemotaxis protein